MDQPTSRGLPRSIVGSQSTTPTKTSFFSNQDLPEDDVCTCENCAASCIYGCEGMPQQQQPATGEEACGCAPTCAASGSGAALAAMRVPAPGLTPCSPTLEEPCPAFDTARTYGPAPAPRLRPSAADSSPSFSSHEPDPSPGRRPTSASSFSSGPAPAMARYSSAASSPHSGSLAQSFSTPDPSPGRRPTSASSFSSGPAPAMARHSSAASSPHTGSLAHSFSSPAPALGHRPSSASSSSSGRVPPVAGRPSAATSFSYDLDPAVARRSTAASSLYPGTPVPSRRSTSSRTPLPASSATSFSSSPPSPVPAASATSFGSTSSAGGARPPPPRCPSQARCPPPPAPCFPGMLRIPIIPVQLIGQQPGSFMMGAGGLCPSGPGVPPAPGPRAYAPFPAGACTGPILAGLVGRTLGAVCSDPTPGWGGSCPPQGSASLPVASVNCPQAPRPCLLPTQTCGGCPAPAPAAYTCPGSSDLANCTRSMAVQTQPSRATLSADASVSQATQSGPGTVSLTSTVTFGPPSAPPPPPLPDEPPPPMFEADETTETTETTDLSEPTDLSEATETDEALCGPRCHRAPPEERACPAPGVEMCTRLCPGETGAGGTCPPAGTPCAPTCPTAKSGFCPTPRPRPPPPPRATATATATATPPLAFGAAESGSCATHCPSSQLCSGKGALGFPSSRYPNRSRKTPAMGSCTPNTPYELCSLSYRSPRCNYRSIFIKPPASTRRGRGGARRGGAGRGASRRSSSGSGAGTGTGSGSQSEAQTDDQAEAEAKAEANAEAKAKVEAKTKAGTGAKPRGAARGRPPLRARPASKPSAS